MTRILVLGASGMLGHKLMQRLSQQFDVIGTIRDAEPHPRIARVLDGQTLIGGVAAEDLSSIEHAIRRAEADIMINCIGIIKQSQAAKDAVPSLTVNALLPHQIAGITTELGARLIHFSTDCVFSGRRGRYTEDDIPDGEDLYGRTKLLGEVAGPGCLTLRTSIVGRELRGHLSLIDWLLSQRGGQVRGFAKAIYTGLTTNAMADLVAWIITDHPDLDGLWHVSADPISKFDLLGIVNRAYDLGTQIEKDEAFFCDRSLDSSRFRQRTGWQPISWDEMIIAMRADSTPYTF